MATEDAKNTPSQEQMPDKGRRDTLKTLATVPILGALAYGVYQKRKDALRGRIISDVFQVSNRQASYLEPQGDGKKIRIGLVGFGIRGKQLMRAAGFAEPSWIDKMKEANKLNKKDTRYQQYMEQDDLNIEITAVCDMSRKRTVSSAVIGVRALMMPLLSLVRTTGIARSLWLRHVPESMYIARNRYHGRFLRRIWFAK